MRILVDVCHECGGRLEVEALERDDEFGAPTLFAVTLDLTCSQCGVVQQLTVESEEI